MKTNLRKFLLLAIILLSPNVVRAESLCSYSEQAELNNIVGHVTAKYEAVDVYNGKAVDVDRQDENGNAPEVDFYLRGLKISILNITEEISVKVTSKNDGKEYTFEYKDTDNGVAEITTTDVEELNTYTIEVFANKYACIGERYRTFDLKTPMYNFYSQLQVCEENPGYYYCQEFIPTNNINAEAFYKNIENYQQEEESPIEEPENKNFLDKLKEFYENNKLIIYSVGMVIVVAGVATTVILIKKKRSRVL